MILFQAESIAVAAGFKFFEETLANGATYKGQFSHFPLTIFLQATKTATGNEKDLENSFGLTKATIRASSKTDSGQAMAC